MPLPRELDGGGAEDGLGALPGLRAQVPEVQMFAEGACYFQAAQGAPPPRYEQNQLRCGSSWRLQSYRAWSTAW